MTGQIFFFFQDNLLLDPKHQFVVAFPFTRSEVELEDIKVPESYNNLHLLIKIIWAREVTIIDVK